MSTHPPTHPNPGRLPLTGRVAIVTGVSRRTGIGFAIARSTDARVEHVEEDLADRGITVNTVDPGPTDTGWADPDRDAAVADRMPRGRWGTPDDAARLIAWLATDNADWITGRVIDSTGGWR